MIKIVKTLCKYLFPRFKKVCLSAKVKDLRDELLQNCKYAIKQLKDHQKKVYSYSINAMTGSSTPDKPIDNTTTESLGTKQSESDISYEFSDREIINSFMILTHGVLIQEWEHFLYGIFEEGLIYYLRGYDLGKPKFDIKFKNLNPTMEISKIHENIASEAKKSLYGYKNLINNLLKLFNFDENFKNAECHEEMNKHEIIRNIWQHQRGKPKNKDFKELYGDEKSKKYKKYFELHNDKDELVKYKEDETIILFKKEIQKLYDTIEQYSKVFQTRAEQAQSSS